VYFVPRISHIRMIFVTPRRIFRFFFERLDPVAAFVNRKMFFWKNAESLQRWT
jgi:hypothetical protein